MGVIHLHVGLHKTGTTSLQKSLHARRIELSMHGWLYPTFPIDAANHGVALFSLFSPQPDTFHAHLGAGRSAERILELNAATDRQLDIVLDSGAPNIIISGEDLSWNRPPLLARLASRLRAHNHAVRVIAFVRDPEEFVTSLTQEELKVGARLSPLLLDPPATNYRDRLEPFITEFGREACHIGVFSKDTIFADFLAALGMPERLAASVPVLRENVSMSAEAALILDAANGLYPISVDGKKNPARADLLSKQIQQIKGARFELPASTRAIIAERAKPDVEWLTELLGRAPFPKKNRRRAKRATLWDAATVESIAQALNEAGKQRDKLWVHQEKLQKDLAALRASASAAPHGKKP